MLRLKPLFQTFGYTTIVETCARENWILPFAADLRGQTLPDLDKEYTSVWVADLPPDEKDRETHAMIYSRHADKLHLCNKDFRQLIIVLKEV